MRTASALSDLVARSRQVVVFLAGGVLSAAVDIGVLQLLLHAGLHFAGATTAGFLSGLLVNYAWHSRVTFDAAATPASFGRYLCVVLLNYLLTLGCVALAQALLGMPLAGKIASLPLISINSYLLGKYWIFK
ncbi:GtrA family protein [uncultured Massilia sp.]|uniref:GtrA family protein n=1 Tax=uncultured Massilia sp. TaxID=169973 RepID=UPI0025D7AD22|nr:GtrA family protein [uncultured Massilia sp.]